MRPSASPATGSEAAPTVGPPGARRTMDALAQTGDAFEVFFEQAGVGLALADLSTRYVRVNAAYAKIVGRSAEDLVGISFRELLHPDAATGTDTSVVLLLRGDSPSLQADERYVRPDGEEVWVLHGVTVVRDAAGSPLWFAVSAQDITERRQVERHLKEKAEVLSQRVVRDPLTGLANRVLLEERMTGALARDARSGTTTGVLFLDLDGFKEVNDQHGHAAGDGVLREVARRLLGHVRPSDTVARIGGDEFVVLVEQVPGEGLLPLAARLEESVGAPYQVGPTVSVGVSVGTATSTGGEGDAAGLLALADRRMYAVKHSRRG